MIDGSSCLQRRIFSDVSRVFGSEDTQGLFVGEVRGKALCAVEVVGGGEVSSLWLFFGWYLLDYRQADGAICRKDVPRLVCIGCIEYFRLLGKREGDASTVWGNQVISAQLLVLECNEVRPKIRHVVPTKIRRKGSWICALF
jgi:hypothetical protein